MLRVTPQALTQLRQLAAEAGCKRPIVVVIWVPAQKEVTRGPRGEVIWTQERDAHWSVSVTDWDALTWADGLEVQVPTSIIEGLEFYFARSATQPVLAERVLGLANGDFVVR